jgi:ABC-type protease/lipase transport system fused ATPase/permease subunit
LGECVLFEAIEQLKAANVTVVIITHRMGILAATNKIAIMQGGAVSAFGDSQDIFDKYVSPPSAASPKGGPAQATVSAKAALPSRARVRGTPKRARAFSVRSEGPAS